MDLKASVANVLKTARQINVLAEFVVKNKEDCWKVSTRVERLSAIVERLGTTDVVSSKQTTIDVVNKIEETLHRALNLVEACLTKNNVLFFITDGKVSKQLREVKEEITELMHILNFSITVQQTVMLGREYIKDQAVKSQSYIDGVSTEVSESSSSLSSSSEMTDQESERKTLEAVMIDASAKPASLSYAFIKSITRNFSEEIGRGGFGVVYMGHLRTGMVAVKKLSILQGFFDKLFMEEINCLIKTRHNNVVRFLGYCCDSHGELVPFNQSHVMAEVPQRLLCFEYVPNGNLQAYLKEKSHKDEWEIRYKMIRGICHGLNYLHEQRIVHLDLKPENILLGSHLEPKITDFGVSKCFDEGVTRVQTENIRGTLGSTAPEIIDSGEITYKSDIYGLGIIITKLLTGCNKYDFDNWHTSLVVDSPRVKSCIEIAQKCVAFDQNDRPTIGEIMQKLNEIDTYFWL